MRRRVSDEFSIKGFVDRVRNPKLVWSHLHLGRGKDARSPVLIKRNAIRSRACLSSHAALSVFHRGSKQNFYFAVFWKHVAYGTDYFPAFAALFSNYQEA